MEWARDAGAERIVVMGHSFGGAVAIRTAVLMPASVVGVVTFATQSAGCEVAGALAGRPLLLFHGDRDELLPPESSQMVQTIAGSGEVVLLPGDGHVLAKSDARDHRAARRLASGGARCLTDLVPAATRDLVAG